ncbi:putative NAC domain-containing protein 94 isoform X1 [Oryza brachyantha]|uniref:Hypothetical_protein n=1 Tax=Oryza brachyantha TaxID=4533 RepID=G2XM83_ORYBR|nr:putative NAC domain-containing protein 94 isoform X1 [Oryza brachyantha]CBX25301.1 hypothetical_protein [Oryza brachyantha]
MENGAGAGAITQLIESGGGGGGQPVPKRHELVVQLQFPSGFHFSPTDEELVDVYLRCKIEGRKAPLDVVNEVNIMCYHPENLIEKYRAYGEHRWFFTMVREASKTKKKGEPNRKVKVDDVEVGSWSATGSVVQIHSTKEANRKAIIGSKRVLTFKSAIASEEDRWSMHEYVMAGKSEMGQYVLCAIQLKQTYEAEKKAAEDGKKHNRRTRKAKRVAAMGEAQEEGQHETPPPEEDVCTSMASMFAAEEDVCTSMTSMFAAEEDAAMADANDGMAQADHQSSESYAAMCSEAEPVYYADQFAFAAPDDSSSCGGGNCLSYQHPATGSAASAGQAQYHVQYYQICSQDGGNMGVCSTNAGLHYNMLMGGQVQNQICSQGNVGVIGGSEDWTAFHVAVSCDQLIAAQQVERLPIGDMSSRTYFQDTDMNDFKDIFGDDDNVEIPNQWE